MAILEARLRDLLAVFPIVVACSDAGGDAPVPSASGGSTSGGSLAGGTSGGVIATGGTATGGMAIAGRPSGGTATGGVLSTGGTSGGTLSTGGSVPTGGVPPTAGAFTGGAPTGGSSPQVTGGSTSLGGGGAAAGAAGMPAGGSNARVLSFETDIWPVFALIRDPIFVYYDGSTYESCVTVGVCHGGASPGAGLRMPDADVAYEQLFEVPSRTSLCDDTVRVVPGEPEQSCLILFYEQRLRTELEWVNEAEIDLVRQWIAQGARP